MNKKFLKLMQNRLVMGRLRYGPMAEKRPYDFHGDLIGRIDKYYQSGNLEFLVDVGNMALLSWLFPPRLPDVHLEIRDHLVGHLGLGPLPPPSQLYRLEWCPGFERAMAAAFPTVKYVSRFGVREELHRLTRALEYPAVAATAALEFDYPTHHEAHWAPVDRK